MCGSADNVAEPPLSNRIRRCNSISGRLLQRGGPSGVQLGLLHRWCRHKARNLPHAASTRRLATRRLEPPQMVLPRVSRLVQLSRERARRPVLFLRSAKVNRMLRNRFVSRWWRSVSRSYRGEMHEFP